MIIILRTYDNWVICLFDSQVKNMKRCFFASLIPKRFFSINMQKCLIKCITLSYAFNMSQPPSKRRRIELSLEDKINLLRDSEKNPKPTIKVCILSVIIFPGEQ